MPWFKVDDKLHDHSKVRRAKKAAMGVWVLAGSWCMDNLTDGFVPESVLNRWGNRRDATQLCTANLWDPVEKDGEKGWQFRNWHEFQPSRAEVESEREATKERVKKWREGKRRNAVTNAVTNDVTNGDVTPEVRTPRPDPTRPDHKEERSRKRAVQLPEGFEPNDSNIQLAVSEGVDLRRELAKFVDYNRAKGTTYKDWHLALNNWIRKAAEYGNVRPIQRPTTPAGEPILPFASDDRR